MSVGRQVISIMLSLVLGSGHLGVGSPFLACTTAGGDQAGMKSSLVYSTYTKYQNDIEEFNQKKSNSSILSPEKWEDIDSEYWEIISPMYATREFGIADTGEEYPEGMLTAKIDEQHVIEMRIALLDRQGWMEYEYYRWEDIVYISCTRENRRERRLIPVPEYQVSEYCLSYYGTWEDETLWERTRYVEALENRENLHRKEYYIIEENIYEWDNKAKSLTGIAEDPVRNMANWLFWEAERVFRWMQATPETTEKVQWLLPDTFHLLDTVVCDFNEDQKEDYVVMVYQNKELVGDRIWVDAQIGLLLSVGNGSYDKKILLDQNAAYCYIELFPGDLLMVQNDWNRVDGSWIIQTEYFRFAREEQEFHLHKALQSDLHTYLRIKGENEIECTMAEYYANRREWDSTGVYSDATGRIEGLTLFLEDFPPEAGNEGIRKAEEALYKRIKEIQKRYDLSPHIQIVYEDEMVIGGRITCNKYEKEFCISKIACRCCLY